MFSISFSTISAPEFPIVGLRWNEIKILELITQSLLSLRSGDEERSTTQSDVLYQAIIQL